MTIGNATVHVNETVWVKPNFEGKKCLIQYWRKKDTTLTQEAAEKTLKEGLNRSGFIGLPLVMVFMIFGNRLCDSDNRDFITNRTIHLVEPR